LLKKRKKSGDKEKLKIFGPVAFIIIIGFFVSYQFVAPAPPRHVSIATGSPDGAYFAYGKAYSKILKRNGIQLEVRETAGSVENLGLLEADAGGVDMAFMQGGIGALAKSDDIRSIGSLYYEPLWIFHQTNIKPDRLSDLKGLRISVGLEGSGTKILAINMLGLNGITANNTRLFSYSHQKSVDMLLSREIDVAIFVTTRRAPFLQELLKSKEISLMGLERAEAYAKRYHYLYVHKLPEGMINFEANFPERDITLVAPTTQLVVRSDLHPALIGMLLQTAQEVHGTGSEMERAGEFPSPKYLDFKLSKEAERFYRSGPPFLQRYFPFWVANFLSRMKSMLLPLLVLLYPLLKLMPSIYRWRMRARIYRWYAKLDDVDPDTYEAGITAHLDEYMDELDRIEKDVSNISVPHSYSEELFQLRLHIEMLRNKLLKTLKKD
jgi:TRAP transporter TAXI family solute receptor